MVSVCTVIIKGMEPYARVLCSSTLRHCPNVREIIIVRSDMDDTTVIDEAEVNGVRLRLLGLSMFKEPVGYNRKWDDFVCGHALGLHHAIDNACQPYVWMTDPDIFYFGPTDRIYLDLMQRYGLAVIGVSHYNPGEQSYADFPCCINLMCRKADLPDENWMSGKLAVQSQMTLFRGPTQLRLLGKYMLPGPTSDCHLFPRPQGIFDAGCNLWLWNEERQGRWLGFTMPIHRETFTNNYGVDELLYPLNYSCARYTTNFSLTDDLGETELLYHRTRGAKVPPEGFVGLYEKLFPGDGPVINFPPMG